MGFYGGPWGLLGGNTADDEGTEVLYRVSKDGRDCFNIAKRQILVKTMMFLEMDFTCTNQIRISFIKKIICVSHNYTIETLIRKK